jgi:broad specificity phosphatase PhoE
MLDIYLIRHAESEINKRRDLIVGRSNSAPLSTRGMDQSDLLGKRLKNSGIVFSNIYSSSATRSIETAKKAVAYFGLSLNDILVTPEILELDQGDWEGKRRDQVYTPDVLSDINMNNWRFTPPNGESQKDVEERMLRWLDKCVLSNFPEKRTIAVFSHAMAIKCLLRGIMDFSPDLTYKVNIANTSITRLQYSDRGWCLITLNDTAHLFCEEN